MCAICIQRKSGTISLRLSLASHKEPKSTGNDTRLLSEVPSNDRYDEPEGGCTGEQDQPPQLPPISVTPSGGPTCRVTLPSGPPTPENQPHCTQSATAPIVAMGSCSTPPISTADSQSAPRQQSECNNSVPPLVAPVELPCQGNEVFEVTVEVTTPLLFVLSLRSEYLQCCVQLASWNESYLATCVSSRGLLASSENPRVSCPTQHRFASSGARLPIWLTTTTSVRTFQASSNTERGRREISTPASHQVE